MEPENTKTSNPKAFPSDLYLENGESQKGMTLRDYFANSAMQGIVSTLNGNESTIYYDKIAEDAFKISDAMLKQREIDNL